MSDSSTTTQMLGEAGETCGGCGATLAADQRYCLNCGRRRGEPRIEFERYAPGAGGASANGVPRAAQPEGDVAARPAGGGPRRDYTPLAAVGGIAVLGVMLLIGVLIGKGGGGDTAATPAPVVVRGGEAESSTNTAGEEGGAGKSEATGAKSKGGKGSGGGKGKGVSGGSASTGSAPVASDAELQQLQEQSPQEYAENSAKLPDEIATGGAPPPEDNKAPGGGSAGTAIE